MTIFADPVYLLLLLAIPIWLWGRRRWFGPPSLEFSSLAVLEPRLGTGRARWAGLPVALQVLGIIAVVIALARPVQEKQGVTLTTEGIDILLLLDVSSSMSGNALAEDRSNLEVAKDVVDNFVDARPHDRMGLIAFARYPKRICPLTTDRDAVKAFIDELAAVPRGSGRDGTGIGAALAEAARLVSDMLDAQPPEAEAGDRVVVLLTDGEENQHRIEPLDAARLLADAGIRAYTVSAAGSDRTEDGAVLSKPDSSLLEAVARMTGGKHSLAGNAKDLEAIYRDIDDLEKKPVKRETYSEERDYFQAFLVVAVLLILLGFVKEKTLLLRVP
ncbi:MAG: vWA domain-containing protein [Planctomycetota bacterium]|jgi:Ca-activated chloride channel family protein